MLTPESFRDIPAHRVRCVLGLRMQPLIPCECRPFGVREDENTNLIGELPDNQVLIPACTAHGDGWSTSLAAAVSSQIVHARHLRCRTRNRPRSHTLPFLNPNMCTHRPGSDLHRPGSDLHRPGSNLHRPESDLHRPESNLHRPGSDSHRPGSNLHRPGEACLHQPGAASLHRPAADLHQPASDLHRPGAASSHPPPTTISRRRIRASARSGPSGTRSSRR